MPRIPVLDGNDCIGCETCTRICPKVFHMIDEHEAAVLNPTGDTEEKIEEAMDACPVACINWDE